MKFLHHAPLMDAVKKYQNEILLFVMAFVLRALYAILIQCTSGSHGFIAFSDAEYFYYHAALNVLNHGSFSIALHEPWYPNAFHTPLYPLFLASLLFLKLPLLGIAFVQAVLGAAIVVVSYKIGSAFADQRVAFWGAVFVMIEPMSLYWGGLLMSDTLFAFLMMLSFWALASLRYEYVAIALGLAALTRPIALIFVPVFVIFAIWQWHRDKKTTGIILQNALLMVVIVGVIIAPWFVRNKIVFNTWGYTSAGWYDIYAYPVDVFARERGIPIEQIEPDIDGDRNFTRFSFSYTPQYRQAAYNVIGQDRIAFFAFLTKRSLSALFTDRYEYLVNVMLRGEMPRLYESASPATWSTLLFIGRIFWFLVYVFSLAALTRPRLLPWGVFMFCLIGINALISGGINPGGSEMSRYSLPFLAFFFTFAGAGAQWLWGKLLRKRT